MPHQVTIQTRPVSPLTTTTLERGGVHPLFARLYAARGISNPQIIDGSLSDLEKPDALRNIEAATHLLATALLDSKRVLVVGDYDCDGATASAIALRGLRSLALACGSAARFDYLVPRREMGYGLSPQVVELALQHPRLGKPDVLITVDNGIASLEGVDAALQKDIAVLVTDHHLPGEQLPNAIIVNPNQPGCRFPSKNICGAGVMFYVLIALRALLQAQGVFSDKPPPLGNLLDLVALATIADLVPLDRNNRILVKYGLERLRSGRSCPGIRALFSIAGRHSNRANCADLGFVVGPRINAAGRLDDMSVGIECLLTDDMQRALQLAQQLDQINQERRSVDKQQEEEAKEYLDETAIAEHFTLCLMQKDWHAGVLGITAARLKNRYHRPCIIFGGEIDNEVRGSGRSIPSLHLRDCLDRVNKKHPGLIKRFGGHAAAAGLSIVADRFEYFKEAFEAETRTLLNSDDLLQTVVTDGELPTAYWSLGISKRLYDDTVWGQGFPPPIFSDTFRVRSQTVLKDRHTKLILEKNGQVQEAIHFGNTDTYTETVRIAYRPVSDQYQGLERVVFHIEAWETMGA